MTEGGKEAVRADDEVVANAEVRALEKRIRELERVLGKKTLENEILREAVKVAHEKKMDLALAVLTRREYAVRRVAKVLEVSRSQLHERLRSGLTPRRRYQKTLMTPSFWNRSGAWWMSVPRMAIVVSARC
jgi:transposase